LSFWPPRPQILTERSGLGEEIDTDTGNKYTVSGLRRVPSNNQFNTPPPGGYFDALDVKECAGQAALTTNPSEWSLGLSDDSQIQGGSSALVTTLAWTSRS
jgi:hypothetical protein